MPHDGQEESSVAFVVTGFGPFRGVSDNPTTTIVNALPSHLADLAAAATKEDHCGGTACASVSSVNAQYIASNTTTNIFETSAQDVKKSIDDLFAAGGGIINTTGCEDVVLLHLGVNYMGQWFQVESAAYNDATFRVADERGYQPKGECIISAEENDESCSCEVGMKRMEAPPYGQKLSTTLKVPSLIQQMSSERGYGDCVRGSSDPGRFVCNYAYCYSLHKSSRYNETLEAAKQSGEGVDGDCCCTTVHSLFLHVPPFHVVEMETQMAFVCDLMDLIQTQLAQMRGRCGAEDR